MEKKVKFGFFSQGYEAPRAEGVEVAQESVLCASPINGVTSTTYEEDVIDSGGGW